MIKNICFLLVFCLGCGMGAQAAPQQLNTRQFAQLPVQRAGRIQPLDSFARYYAKQFYGAAPQTITASDWLAELVFAPARAYQRETFAIAHPDVRRALGLPDTKRHLYSFQAVTAAMAEHHDMMKSLLTAAPENITDPAQQQILALYQNMLIYFDISRSLSLVLPDFRIDDPALAQKLGLPASQDFSYLQMIQHKAAYLRLARADLKNLGDRVPSAREDSLLKTGYLLEQMEADKHSRILQIIPPLWSTNPDLWLSPWMMLAAGQGSPQSAALLNAWETLATAYRAQDQQAWDAACKNIVTQTKHLTGDAVRPAALATEYIYNCAHIFVWSGVGYLIALLMLIAARSRKTTLHRMPIVALIAGFLLHSTGLMLRIFILARPPVGTLYESILFVGWVAAAGSLVLEWRNKQGLGILIGALSGLVLLALAPLFAQGGDTMEPLVAVLNTNFWLATHVLAITTGYGCCLVTGLVAHIYLVQKIRAPHHREQLATLSRAMLGAALVALCFATIGTVLGGIWADQSWGRFWGWDPKENGALLIVLWLLFILHGKLSGLLRADNFALGAAATITIVAVSWFGVNLLNVGLHSYGFTSGIALYLGLFVIAELGILGACKMLLHRQTQRTS